MMIEPGSDLDEVARRFALLADPTRLHILNVVHERGEGTVSEIAGEAGASVANASQHLQRLLHGGILGRRRDGQTVRYRVVDDTVEQLCAIVCDSIDRRPARGATAPTGQSGRSE